MAPQSTLQHLNCRQHLNCGPGTSTSTVTQMNRCPFSESGAFGSKNAYTSVLCELGTPAKGLAGVVLGTININVMMTPRSGVSVDDDEVDGVGDEIGDVDDNEVDGVGDKIGDVNDNEVDGVGDKVGGVNTSVQCVDLMLEVIPGPQWTTAFGSILIRTANLLWVPSDVR
ncbi:hypothetical protein NDA14_005054 [Ustilago hordei]|nr:hypothetical protein NDA14_005054 [Ustilago hordei]